MSYADPSRAPKPDYDNLAQEPSGPVAKDSLAAESIRAGGEFGENENAEPLGVKGGNSTFNTTDTSGATTLRSAPDAPTRQKEEFQGLGSDERGHTGIKYPDADAGDYSRPTAGSGTSDGAYSGATGDSFAEGAVDTSSSGYDPNIRSGQSATQRPSDYGTGPGSDPIATGRAGDAFGIATRPSGTMASTTANAPNYAGRVSGAIQAEGELQPKGRNLVEGDVPQTKTFTGDVGGPNDPGRLAEQDFQKMDSENLIEAGGRQFRGSGGQSSNDNPFDVLSSESAPNRDA